MASFTRGIVMAKLEKTTDHRQTKDPAGYVPSARVLNNVIKRETNAAGKPTVTMSADAFHKLLAAALNPGFNEKSYLDQHPDVKRRVEDNAVPSGLSHFVTHGFYEGRSGFDIAVDAKWYLATYPDVARAIKDKQVIDAKDHFMLFGYAEGRNPGPAFQRIVAEWNQLARAEQEAT